jgi:hypothetical protein
VELFLAFKFLHIATMFFAVAAALFGEIGVQAVARRGDVLGLRALGPTLEVLGKAGPVLFLTGLAFGLLAAWTGEFNLLAPWLLISYALFAFAMAVGALVSGPWAKRVVEAAFASPSEEPSVELRAAIADRRGPVSSAVLAVVIVTFVFVMVFKPLS